MSVTTWIPTSSRGKRLLVDKDAIIRREAGNYLYKVSGSEENGYVAEQIPVTILFEVGKAVAIETNAVGAGDYVIVEGNERMMPNTPVDISIEEGKNA